MQFNILLIILCAIGFAYANSDIDALLEFKKGINKDPSRHIVDSWNQVNLQESDGCPLNWYGVQCNGNRVLSITLNDMELNGTIDFSALAKMEMLTNLSLSNNNFVGHLSPYVGSISSLKVLDLSRNGFIGPIPSDLAKITTLVYLNLSSNNFEGPVPSGFGNLEKLMYLDLRSNKFSGDIDGILGKSQSIVHVDISDNQLDGTFESISDNSAITDSLKYLNISHNKLSGELFARLPVPMFDILEVFDVSHNELKGNVPSFNFIFSLRILRLGNNQLSGSLPEALFKENSMVIEDVDLSCNQLTGPVKTITSKTLKTLNLSTNKLAGSLPMRVGMTCATVDLSSNLFSGNLSNVKNWGNYVEEINLNSNKLEGSLPNETSQFLRLASFKASNNMISGELPDVIGTYPELNFIDFSLNKLYGTLPSSLFSSIRLVHVNLSGNSFNGSIPFVHSQQNVSLASLDVSNNALSGALPKEIGMMHELKVLNIGKNNISGQIPGEIGLLHSLTYLDLSNNHFEGKIPDKLPNSLVGFNVSYNGLSGHVPSNLLKFPMSSFYPGNQLLVLPNAPPSSIPYTIRKGKNSHHMKKAVMYILIAGVFFTIVLIILTLFLCKKLSHRSDVNNNRQIAYAKSPALTSTLSRDQLLSSEASLTPHVHDNSPRDSRKAKSPDIDIARNSPPKRQGKTSISHIISSPPPQNPSSPNSPSMLSVRSPDRLAGDLHLFENNIRFSAEDLSKAPAEIIGRSCHGTSYKATLTSGHVLCVKWLREGIVKSKKEFSRESKKLGGIKHPNIVSLRGYYWGPKEHERLIISDYVYSVSLTAYLCEHEQRNLQPLSLLQRLTIAIDIASCLNYLHNERTIPHGNLKSSNVIIIQSQNMNALLTDYTLHRLMTAAGMADQVLNAGALGYCPPEFANTSTPCPSLKSDVYAYGVVLLEILTGKNAGEIVSGNPGVVDLTDWVRLLYREKRTYECYDRVIKNVNTNAMESMLSVALRCIRSASERPEIRTIYEDLSSISL